MKLPGHLRSRLKRRGGCAWGVSPSQGRPAGRGLASAAFRQDAGAALLEFSLIVPIVALMFLAVVDFGIAISQAMTVEDAARAGAEYGTIAGNANDYTGMTDAATTAANGLAGFTVTPAPTTWCSCTPGGTVVSCSSTCSGANPVEYVQVQTAASVQVLAGYPGIPSSFALKGLAVMRVQ